MYVTELDMEWIQSMDWIGLGGKNVTPFLISNHCSTVYAISYKLCFMKAQLSGFYTIKN